mmetsp:Transcript_7541/g.14748  ORF Transcript_7541/g.14748 Transcript_7541/m.14748 type:complete len:214 (+) Transcript_7541:499-1140(+)
MTGGYHQEPPDSLSPAWGRSCGDHRLRLLRRPADGFLALLLFFFSAQPSIRCCQANDLPFLTVAWMIESTTSSVGSRFFSPSPSPPSCASRSSCHISTAFSWSSLSSSKGTEHFSPSSFLVSNAVTTSIMFSSSSAESPCTNSSYFSTSGISTRSCPGHLYSDFLSGRMRSWQVKLHLMCPCLPGFANEAFFTTHGRPLTMIVPLTLTWDASI